MIDTSEDDAFLRMVHRVREQSSNMDKVRARELLQRAIEIEGLAAQAMNAASNLRAELRRIIGND